MSEARPHLSHKPSNVQCCDDCTGLLVLSGAHEDAAAHCVPSGAQNQSSVSWLIFAAIRKHLCNAAISCTSDHGVNASLLWALA